MTLGQLQSFLAWGALLNYATLVVAFTAWALAGDALQSLHSRWFPIEREHCHAAVYLMLGLYKLGIWLLFVVPWVAVCIVRRAS